MKCIVNTKYTQLNLLNNQKYLSKDKCLPYFFQYV